MNEPFLLSNLIELQELDNEIFKLISEKSEGTTVKELKTHEIEFKKLQSDKQNIENELQLYTDAKSHIEKSILESLFRAVDVLALNIILVLIQNQVKMT